MKLRADLHLHTRYASSTSSDATILNIVKGARKKGLELMGTGDCLHPKVLEVLGNMENRNGLFYREGIYMVLQGEVEDFNGAHHLLFFQNIHDVEKFRELVRSHSNDIDTEGRPTIDLFGHEIAKMVLDCRGLIGPAHYFTPYKGILSLYGGLEKCYKDFSRNIGFIELGLSGNGDMGQKIPEITDKIFLSNSDAHSCSQERLGREFNLLEMNNIDIDGVFGALGGGEQRKRNGGNVGALVANYGLPPQAGRYHLTACAGCHQKVKLEMGRKKRMRCECGGRIRMGVKDIARLHGMSKKREGTIRILEGAGTGGNEKTYRPRNPYHYTMPLAEIITGTYGWGVSSQKNQNMYEDIMAISKNELEIIFNGDVRREISDKFPPIGQAYERLEEKTFTYVAGGGGRYGKIILHGIESPGMKETTENDQKSLFNF